MFRKIAVQITERSVVNVYSDITCSIDDRLVIETKSGLVIAQSDPETAGLLDEYNQLIGGK